jgi:hypothetical protein
MPRKPEAPLAKVFGRTKGEKKVTALVVHHMSIDGGLDTHRKSISLGERANLCRKLAT